MKNPPGMMNEPERATALRGKEFTMRATTPLAMVEPRKSPTQARSALASIRAQLKPPREDESLGSEAFRAIDRMGEALSAKVTGGLSPAALALAFFDWSIHLSSSTGKQMELAD